MGVASAVTRLSNVLCVVSIASAFDAAPVCSAGASFRRGRGCTHHHPSYASSAVGFCAGRVRASGCRSTPPLGGLHPSLRSCGDGSFPGMPPRRCRSSSLLFSAATSQDEGGSDSSTDRDDASERRNWTSQTVAIALPALAGMMTDPLLSMVDTLFVGRLGSPSSSSAMGGAATSSVPLAALGACTSIFHLSFHCFRATTLSTSSLVAGALVQDEEGGEDHNDKEAVLIAKTSIEQAILTGVLITTFLLVFGPRCLFAMGISPPASSGCDGLFPSALTYLNNRAIAAPAVVMLAAAEGIFRGHGDVITPWKVSCVVALLNLILDPWCMFSGKRRWAGLGMGIKGAAVATAFSQICGAFLYGRWLLGKGLLGSRENRQTKPEKSDVAQQKNAAMLKQQKRTIASTILRANASMMLKQGSLLLGWAYATSKATRMGNAVVASHQVALSIWLVVALVLEGAGVAAQVLMAKEWESLKVLEKRLSVANGSRSEEKEAVEPINRQRRTIRSLSVYMMAVSVVQGLVGSLAMLLLRQAQPSIILTQDLAVRQNLLTLLPHIAGQMVLVSTTLVAEALAIGGGRFKWLAGGTTVSSVVAMVKLRGAKDLVEIWNSGIVALFVGRLVTALAAVLDMNDVFQWRKKAARKETGLSPA